MPVFVGTEQQDYLTGTADADVLSAGGGNDYLRGGGGDDSIDGGTGSDTLLAGENVLGLSVDLEAGTAIGEGTDRLTGIENVSGSPVDDVLIGNREDNVLSGNGGADRISGGGGNDSLDGGLYGAQAIDRLDGGDGDDTILVGLDDFADGGPGFDTLQIDLFGLEEGLVIDLSPMWGGGTAAVGSGTVTGFEWVYYVRGGRGADVITVGTGGTGHANTGVDGGGGDDRLIGGGNRETLIGRDGDDLAFGMGGDDVLVGFDGADRLEGGEGDDTLMGNGGADILVGGPGNDTYLYSNGETAAGDRFIEDPDHGGFDQVQFWHYIGPVKDSAFAGVRGIEGAHLVSLTDIAGAEFLLGAEFQATGIGTVIASGDVDASQMTSGLVFELAPHNSRSLTVTGGSGDDSLRFGDLTLLSPHKEYVVAGGEGMDTILLDQPINLSAWFAPILLSGFEAIVITGGGEDSAPAAASLSPSGRVFPVALTDEIMEAGTQFTVDASALDAASALQLEVSQLTGGRAVRVLAGAAADRLAGSDGGDALFGADGNDELDGGQGSDVISGDAGADILRGGNGHDRLDGGTGADAMTGGLGNDTYVVDTRRDTITEAESSGVDTVHSSIDFRLTAHFENLVLIGTAGRDGRGNAFANVITGNMGRNVLIGSGGNDVIDGRAGDDLIYGSAGNDSLKGGTGADRFLFTSALGSANVDKILDFFAPKDTINLNQAIFGSAGPKGTLRAAAFQQGSAARDGADRIIYDKASGKIFYDADGTGAAAQILFATVTPGTPLTNADFVIYG